MHTTKRVLRDTVKVAMIRRDVTVGALADQLGLSRAAVHRRLSGVVAWNTDELDAVAAYLDTTVADLVTDSVAATA